jgi:cobalt-zinc-cadmium efflux system outer membrane protein
MRHAAEELLVPIRFGRTPGAGVVLATFACIAAPALAQSPTRVTPDSLILSRPSPEPSGALTLERSLDLAAAHHPGLRGSAWRLRAATARRIDAGRRPSPTASVEVENLGGDPGTDRYEATASLGQTFELGGDRAARVELARASERLAWAELSAEEREVLAQTAERFLETWTLQERVTRLAAAEALAGRSIAAAGERFRAGAGPALEQARAEATRALRRSERLRAAADLTASWQRLVASWGSIEIRFDSLQLAAPVRVTIPPPVRLYAGLESHPQRLRAAAEVAVEDARIREAKAARVGDLEMSGGVRKLADGDATTFVVGASLPLPIGGSRRGIAAAEADRRAVAARAELVALDLRAALRLAYERYLAVAESYELIATRVKPRSEDVLRQLATGYRAGRFSSLEYHDGQRALLDAELQLVEATAEAWRARLALERLLGRSLEALGEEDER